MIVETSALLAIIFDEEEARSFVIAIHRDAVRLISSASVLEAAIVLQRRFGKGGDTELDPLVESLRLEVRPVDLDQLRWARFAFETYGRGRHPAKLNFGDCFSYALAKTTGESLLYKGSDFAQTDLKSAAILYP